MPKLQYNKANGKYHIYIPEDTVKKLKLNPKDQVDVILKKSNDPIGKTYKLLGDVVV